MSRGIYMLDYNKPLRWKSSKTLIHRLLVHDRKGPGYVNYPLIATFIGADGNEALVCPLPNELENVPEDLVRYMATYNGSLDHRGVCATQADCERCIQLGGLGASALTSKAVKVLIKVIE